MSFLDNPKNAGTALWIVGILMVILAIVEIAYIFIDGLGILNVVPAIGSIIAGFVYFGFGKSVRAGAITEKWDVLCTFVKTVAVVSIINGIFTLPVSIGTGIIDIVIALVIFYAYKKMTDGQATTMDKIIWIILLIIFIFGIIGGIIEIIAIVTLPLGICDFIIYAFMLIAILDGEVKAKMGM